MGQRSTRLFSVSLGETLQSVLMALHPRVCFASFYLLFFYSVLMYYLAVHMSLLIKLCFKNACYFFPEDFVFLSNLIFIGFKKLDLQTIG